MKASRPVAKEHRIALCKAMSARPNKYIYKRRKSLCVQKKIRGKTFQFAYGKDLTLEKARLIAAKVGELSETTNDKTEIMNGLTPFANIVLCTFAWGKHLTLEKARLDVSKKSAEDSASSKK